MEEKHVSEDGKKRKESKKKRSVTVPANKKGRHIMGLLNVLRVIVIPIFWLCLPFRFYGKRKVADGACVYIGNHYRIWDVIYPASTTWEGIHYISKKSVVHNWFMGFFCKHLKAIEVSRDGSDVRAIMDSLKCLKNGEKICIFPKARGIRRMRICCRSNRALPSWRLKRGFPSFPLCSIRSRSPSASIISLSESRLNYGILR